MEGCRWKAQAQPQLAKKAMRFAELGVGVDHNASAIIWVGVQTGVRPSIFWITCLLDFRSMGLLSLYMHVFYKFMKTIPLNVGEDEGCCVHNVRRGSTLLLQPMHWANNHVFHCTVCECAAVHYVYPTSLRSEEHWMFSAASVCLCVCVCVFVCQHDNFRTSKHRMMKLSDRCMVQNSWPSSNLGVIAPECVPPKCGVGLRRWENQRRLSSSLWSYNHIFT